ncbi:hypothetical protein LJR153_007159 [Paenibacillus sp. LjRoot153]
MVRTLLYSEALPKDTSTDKLREFQLLLTQERIELYWPAIGEV